MCMKRSHTVYAHHKTEFNDILEQVLNLLILRLGVYINISGSEYKKKHNPELEYIYSPNIGVLNRQPSHSY